MLANLEIGVGWEFWELNFGVWETSVWNLKSVMNRTCFEKIDRFDRALFVMSALTLYLMCEWWATLTLHYYCRCCSRSVGL